MLLRICADDVRAGDYRYLRDPDLIRLRGLFVAEGRLVVERLIDTPGYRFRSILVSEAARRQLGDALARLGDDVPIYVCEAPDFLGITGYNIHRGCLALVERPEPLRIDALVTGARTLVVLEHVANPDNVGGVFRNVAAFGADAVVLSPTCCDPLYRKAIRTSMAATLRVPFARADEWPGVLEEIRAAGLTIVALTPREPALDLDRFAEACPREPIALLVGNEGAGLTDAAEQAADYRVRIPIRPGVDSLNLATATGIALYRLRRV